MLFLFLFGIFIFLISFIFMVIFILKKKRLTKTNIGMVIGVLMFLIGLYTLPGGVENTKVAEVAIKDVNTEEEKPIIKKESVSKDIPLTKKEKIKKEFKDKNKVKEIEKMPLKDNKNLTKEVKEIKKSSAKKSEKITDETSSLSSSEDNTQKLLDYQLNGEENARLHPAIQGAVLYDKNDSKYQGMDYYFIGKVLKIESVEDLQHNFKEAYLVENEAGYIIPIFPPWEMNISENDNIEAWGMLSGDGYSSNDLGVDNVVDISGAINALSISVEGEIQY